jgi:hypothetical protein
MFIIWYKKIKIKVNHIVAGVYLLSKLGRVEKTERLIIYLNKLNWFTEMYLRTMSNTQMLSYWDIICEIPWISSVCWDKWLIFLFSLLYLVYLKHARIVDTCMCVLLSHVYKLCGSYLKTRNIRSATGCRICGGFTR